MEVGSGKYVTPEHAPVTYFLYVVSYDAIAGSTNKFIQS